MSSEAENSFHNVQQSIQFLEREKYVILFEVGEDACVKVEEVIELCNERLKELNVRIQIGD
jgi:hypothetical protein